MLSVSSLLGGTLAALSILAPQAQSQAAAVVDPDPDSYCFEPSQAYNKKMLDNYLAVWQGEYQLLDSTFMPGMELIADRFPSPAGFGNGSTPKDIHTSEEYLDFIKLARAGWDGYSFDVLRWAGNDHEIAVRWRLNAVMGSNFTTFPTTLEQGDYATWNGTHFLILDECTGLINEVDSSEDLISFLYSLGIDSVTI